MELNSKDAPIRRVVGVRRYEHVNQPVANNTLPCFGTGSIRLHSGQFETSATRVTGTCGESMRASAKARTPAPIVWFRSGSLVNVTWLMLSVPPAQPERSASSWQASGLWRTPAVALAGGEQVTRVTPTDRRTPSTPKLKRWRCNDPMRSAGHKSGLPARCTRYRPVNKSAGVRTGATRPDRLLLPTSAHHLPTGAHFLRP